MECIEIFLTMTILFHGFVVSQDTYSTQNVCGLSGAIDLLQKQVNRQQKELDELKQGSKNDFCGVNDKQDGSYPTDCTELYNNGERTTGVYFIKPSGSEEPFKVFCEMAYDGWTVFQHRFNGSVDFARTWNEYKDGFGNLLGEHWLGNEKLNALTSQGSYIFRFEMHTLDNTNIIAEYDGFHIEGESDFYKLHLGTSLSTRLPIQDSLRYHDSGFFTTWDNEHDNYAPANCARYGSGWWYDGCYRTTPNGKYGCDIYNQCMYWGDGNSINRVFGDSTLLKIKRK